MNKRLEETESSLFDLIIATEGRKVEKRSMNKVFEDRMLALCKIIPPTIGSIIELEKCYKIIGIKYNHVGKIQFIVTENVS